MTAAAWSYPSCCGSEDGDVVIGMDPALTPTGKSTTCTAWLCNSCGVMTVVDISQEPVG